MRELVLSTIKQQNLIAKGELIVLGLSGGADSFALLSVLSELKEELDIKLLAVHVNHGIRGAEADRDAKFSEQIAKELGAEFVLATEDVPEYARINGLSLEEAGRIIRYQTFERLARERGARLIAVAHHADDQVETILFNLVRGSSLNGLSGMEFKSALAGAEDISIIRPLLSVTRQEIENYLLGKGFKSWCVDSTNLSEEYSRNQLRNDIIPKLNTINPRANEHILKAAEDLRAAVMFLDYTAGSEFEKRYSENELDVQGLLALPEILAKRVLYTYICTICGRKKDIERVHVDKLFEMLASQSGKTVDLPYGVRIKKVYDKLTTINRCESFEECEVFSICLSKLKEQGRLKVGQLEFSIIKKDAGFVLSKAPEVKHFDYDLILRETDKLDIRASQEGDYFHPFLDDRRKSISRFFIDEKIENRRLVKVVAYNDHVIYIVGHRNDEHFRVFESTEYILEIRQL